MPTGADECWVFGYGSLVWRPGFAYSERRPGVLHEYARRFWQGSTDHRGVPGAPGRVVTLVPEPGGACGGAAYRLDARRATEVLAALDHRERGGFERLEVELELAAPGERRVAALTYVAGPDNPNYLGPAPLEALASQVRAARGPSGPNREYVVRLAEALADLGLPDPHVEALASQL